jgi:hypothetical protein
MNRNLTPNRNLLSPNKFRLVIDSTRFANIEFFCVEAPLPGLSFAPASANTRGATSYFPGDILEYPEITFRLMVDEEMRNYEEITEWIRRNHAGPIEFHDFALQIYNSSVKLNREIKFISGFPFSIGSVNFNTQTTDVEYLSVDVTFRYDRYEII